MPLSPREKPRLILCSDFRGLGAEINRQLKPYGLRLVYIQRRAWADCIAVEIRPRIKGRFSKAESPTFFKTK